ncbi:MAG: fibronectin type III domain-containing protein [Chitinophagales bacterium]|nr:fibronectin type III domain-containing protein [Chitinophagales bacterium]
MRKVAVKFSVITILAIDAYGGKAQQIHNLLAAQSSSPLFGTPPITMVVFLAMIQTYLNLVAQARDGGKIAIENRNNQRDILTGALFQIAEWATYQVRNEENAVALLESIGFTPTKASKTPVHEIGVPQGLTSDPSQEPGSISIRFETVPHAIGYAIEISEQANGPATVYQNYGFITKSRATITGLDRGKFYTVRLRACNGSAGYSMPSETTSCMAG